MQTHILELGSLAVGQSLNPKGVCVTIGGQLGNS